MSLFSYQLTSHMGAETIESVIEYNMNLRALLLILAQAAIALASNVPVDVTAHTHSVSSVVARLPPLGWNSWDAFQGNLDEPTLMATAAKVKELLLPAGYDTVTVDEVSTNKWFLERRKTSTYMYTYIYIYL